jgi:hypothetical protein
VNGAFALLLLLAGLGCASSELDQPPEKNRYLADHQACWWEATEEGPFGCRDCTISPTSLYEACMIRRGWSSSELVISPQIEEHLPPVPDEDWD